MNSTWINHLRKFFYFLIGIYLIYCFGLFFFQRTMLYPGTSRQTYPPTLQNPDIKSIELKSVSGITQALYLPLKSNKTSSPAIIFAHGNGGLIQDWVTRLAPFRQLGLSILLVEYPGYGDAEGNPSEESIQSALIAGYDWLQLQPEVDPKKIIGMGWSLGGATIASLSKERELAAIILISTFTSLKPFAHDFYVPAFLLRDTFETQTSLQKFFKPVMIFHGINDSVIPHKHSLELSKTTPQAKLYLATGNHDLWLTQEELIVRKIKNLLLLIHHFD